ncbi:MAG: hypothetical protein EZS28_010457 [Streblomastix strix]|uniref:Dynein assembly factor 4, axonemal n=1 Tax=Streblomastix strix TaxID=222440 RepID=A0A5J4WH63_9EUKA|nr:MAG: hypothetical protein EZS28_010457 [Streblomastix strix]
MNFTAIVNFDPTKQTESKINFSIKGPFYSSQEKPYENITCECTKEYFKLRQNIEPHIFCELLFPHEVKQESENIIIAINRTDKNIYVTLEKEEQGIVWDCITIQEKDKLKMKELRNKRIDQHNERMKEKIKKDLQLKEEKQTQQRRSVISQQISIDSSERSRVQEELDRQRYEMLRDFNPEDHVIKDATQEEARAADQKEEDEDDDEEDDDEEEDDEEEKQKDSKSNQKQISQRNDDNQKSIPPVRQSSVIVASFTPKPGVFNVPARSKEDKPVIHRPYVPTNMSDEDKFASEEYLQQEGDKKFKKGDFPSALQQFNAVLNINGNNLHSLNARVITHLNIGNFTEARIDAIKVDKLLDLLSERDQLESIASLTKPNRSGSNQLIQRNNNQIMNQNRNEQLLERKLDVNSSSTNNGGIELDGNNSDEEKLIILQKLPKYDLSQINNLRAKTYARAAIASNGLRQFKEAVEWMNKALKIKPDDEEFKERLAVYKRNVELQAEERYKAFHAPVEEDTKDKEGKIKEFKEFEKEDNEQKENKQEMVKDNNSLVAQHFHVE